jgi:hypothetical protein
MVRMASGELRYKYAQILIVTSSRIFVIGCYVELGTSFDWNVGISRRIASANFRTFLENQSILDRSQDKPHANFHRRTVSSAIASGRPGCCFADSRALSMTDWWYLKTVSS